MNARLPLTSQVLIPARPSDVGAPAPRFPVGAIVRSLAGKPGVVAEVYRDERRVRGSDGNLAWFAADQLVAVRR